MKASDKLRILNAEYQKALHEIHQLTMSQWMELAKALNVATNDRHQAAKIVALRRLAA